ncbi:MULTISPECIES: hypothetical protein [Cytobacillus]|uniref:DUF3954 domain-containing protein n=1 Tax=Cytobacillus oceanisediminis TaxID=665099 RepID=A0ABX3CMD9_9BACI|nr:hypothetical protein [Cytobacillus oceanisediminis]OHX44559.1 hypothetical protein BBV17_25375 [Cytobacillus oceanisediminis]
MLIIDFNKGDKVEIVDVDSIRQGSMLWTNGDIVKIKNVETGDDGYNRLDVWDKDKGLSEYI